LVAHGGHRIYTQSKGDVQMTDRHQVAGALSADAADWSLESVLETLENGRRGYETAAETSDNMEIRALLRELGQARAAAKADLVRVAAEEMGYVPSDSDGTVPGALHRGWIHVKGAVGGDKAIVESAITGEREAHEDLSEALEQSMPEPVAESIRRTIGQVTDAIKRLEAATHSE
jgi:uncharacterized protein (TIGR02284 family)